MCEIHCNAALQLTDVQSGVWSTSARTRGSGRGDGSGLAVGTTCMKDAIRFLDKWSAAMFCTPGMCSGARIRPWDAVKKKRHRIRCIASGDFEVPDLRIATTAALSHWQRMVFPCHCLPHMAHATTTGKSSFTVMCTLLHEGGHWIWNHSPESVNAPQPHPPDASEVIVAAGADLVALLMRAIPFQSSMKRFHHSKSERNA